MMFKLTLALVVCAIVVEGNDTTVCLPGEACDVHQDGTEKQNVETVDENSLLQIQSGTSLASIISDVDKQSLKSSAVSAVNASVDPYDCFEHAGNTSFAMMQLCQLTGVCCPGAAQKWFYPVSQGYPDTWCKPKKNLADVSQSQDGVKACSDQVMADTGCPYVYNAPGKLFYTNGDKCRCCTGSNTNSVSIYASGSGNKLYTVGPKRVSYQKKVCTSNKMLGNVNSVNQCANQVRNNWQCPMNHALGKQFFSNGNICRCCLGATADEVSQTKVDSSIHYMYVAQHWGDSQTGSVEENVPDWLAQR